MIAGRFECVPVVDAHKRIKGAVWWYDFFKDKSHKLSKLDLPVVINTRDAAERTLAVLAGGKG